VSIGAEMACKGTSERGDAIWVDLSFGTVWGGSSSGQD